MLKPTNYETDYRLSNTLFIQSKNKIQFVYSESPKRQNN